MPDSLLTILKVVFLGLLYLFFIRVLRAVWIELREPRTVQVAAVPPAPAPQRQPSPAAPRPQGASQRAKGERLIILEPAELRGRMFELSQELTVGRAPGCGVPLPDDTFVSQLHARVFRGDNGFFVEDLGSTNGTFLNSRPVSTAIPLRKGDRLQVGKTVLELNR